MNCFLLSAHVYHTNFARIVLLIAFRPEVIRVRYINQ